jgi:dipeptidase E
MKLLLTSNGISNPSIERALVDLLGKPIAESSALCVATAMLFRSVGFGGAYRFVAGLNPAQPMTALGWKSLGILELTALPSIDREDWVAAVRGTDALLVFGGDVMFLCHWMRTSGLADLLPSLPELVYVGVSAGSMVLSGDFGRAYDDWFCREPPAPATGLPVADDRALGVVNFSIFPHVDIERSPQNSMANAELWASWRSTPTYAIDDETAIKVVDGNAQVVSEGHWRLFTPSSRETSHHPGE